MPKIKRRRLKKKYRRLFLLIVIVLISILFIKCLFSGKNDSNNDSDNSNNDKINYNDFITNNIESDHSTAIDTIFADGINIDNYKSILNQKPNYLKKSGKYSYIDYNFENKLHYSEIENIIFNLNKSDIVNVDVIGNSVDNRKIYGVEIGKGNKVLYLDANVHAAEIANTLILIKFISEIVNSYENNDKDIINILNNIKLAIIPCMNPDGYEVYNFGVDSLNNKELWWYKNSDNVDFENIKSNANGVDLNRNFPVQNAGMYFKGKKLLYNVSLEKTFSKTAYYGGTELGSEPETKAAMYFMLKHFKNTYAYINLHSQGRVIYAGKPNLSDKFNKITNKFAKDIAKINNYVVYGLSSEEVGEGNDGSVTDFMAELANGFVMSSKTDRLSTDKHINNSATLKYSYPVITIETIRTYTRNPEYFKDEYYNYGIKDALYMLLELSYN